MPDIRRRNRISLTPLIDVVFLLLIFFIMSGSFADYRKVVLEIGSQGSTPASPASALLVRLHQGGSVDLNGEPMNRTDLLRRLEEFTADQGRPALVLQADSEVAVASMVELLDVLRAAGINDIAYLPE